MEDKFVCLNDFASKEVIMDWFMRLETLEYIAKWELYKRNYLFNNEAFEIVKEKVSKNKKIKPDYWMYHVRSKGIYFKDKKIYAHPDIALEFAGYRSPVFKNELRKKIAMGLY